MLRWIPFTALILLAAVVSVFVFLVDQTDQYTPESADPGTVYSEACARCHGERGEGSAWLYPALSGNRDDAQEVIEIVRRGATFMPSFPNIPDSILSRLAGYVAQKSYLENAHSDL